MFVAFLSLPKEHLFHKRSSDVAHKECSRGIRGKVSYVMIYFLPEIIALMLSPEYWYVFKYGKLCGKTAGRIMIILRLISYK